MRAYSFRLASVARVRALQEGIAAQALATASHRLVRAEVELGRAVSELERLTAPVGETSAEDVHWARDQSDRMGQTRQSATQAVDEAGTLREAAREQWIVARRRCAVLERLDDRRRSEWQIAFDRQEAKELDDLAPVGVIGARTRS